MISCQGGAMQDRLAALASLERRAASPPLPFRAGVAKQRYRLNSLNIRSRRRVRGA
jgi:hypothetical protein